MRTYALEATTPAAAEHYARLAAEWDEVSTARIKGTRRLIGARILEVGAGAGFMSLWMAEQVGEHGYVLATDRELAVGVQHERLEVRQHDLSGDEELSGGWDLIHARLTLMHVPERDAVLPRLAGLLAPGGVLCVEDLVPDGLVLHGGTPADRGLYARFRRAVTATFQEAGSDPGWALRVHAAMREAGLQRVKTSAHANAWPGGSNGALLELGLLRQLRAKLEERGLTPNELGRVGALLEDPEWVVMGHRLVSTTGVRVAQAAV